MPVGFGRTIRRTIINAGTATLTGTGNYSFPFGVKNVTVSGSGASGSAGNPGNAGQSGNSGNASWKIGGASVCDRILSCHPRFWCYSRFVECKGCM